MQFDAHSVYDLRLPWGWFERCLDGYRITRIFTNKARCGIDADAGRNEISGIFMSRFQFGGAEEAKTLMKLSVFYSLRAFGPGTLNLRSQMSPMQEHHLSMPTTLL